MFYQIAVSEMQYTPQKKSALHGENEFCITHIYIRIYTSDLEVHTIVSDKPKRL